MGIFSNSTPFDADVEKATDEKNTSDEWGLIMEICDKVGSSPAHAKDCLLSITKRLQSQDPHVVLQAITLLDACINNCGKTFQLEVASRDFDNELKKLVTKWRSGRVGDKLRHLLKSWSEGEMKNDPQLALMSSLYSRLKQEGIDVSIHAEPVSKATRSADPDSVASQQEVDDIAKAIELSLKESSSPKYNGGGLALSSGGGGGTAPGGGGGVGPGGGGLYPSVSAPHLHQAAAAGTGSGVGHQPPPSREVRALYDFEAAEDNELTFFTGEIIHVTDDTDANWWKGYNQRGEGLFPANFVTSSLNDLAARGGEKKEVGFCETVEVRQLEEVREIDEGKIDRVLGLLHEADPQNEATDPQDLRLLEAEVTLMGPLIDAELETSDRKHAQLTQLSSSLVEALNLYHSLMREPKVVGGGGGGGGGQWGYGPLPPPQYHPQQVYQPMPPPPPHQQPPPVFPPFPPHHHHHPPVPPPPQHHHPTNHHP